MRAALIACLLLGGCTLFDDPPDRKCTKDPDCFQAQGETCNLTTKTCEVSDVDASPAQLESEVAP